MIINLLLICVIIILLVKIYLMRKAAKEMQSGLADKLACETNTLIGISSHDKYMCGLAAGLNEELRSLRAMRHNFQQGDLKLKEAVTNISHDIRTPLTAICGYLELLKEVVSQLEQGKAEKAGKAQIAESIGDIKRYLKIIENRTDLLKQMTEELLRYSVAISEEEDMVYEDVVINHVLEESISAYYGALKSAKITPDIYITDEDVKCRLNKNALSRIFGNIISNAIRYSDGDLHIKLSENGEIVFANHAAGFDKIQAGKLFDRFYTVDAAQKSNGLGLSIAKTLTERMGGFISAHIQDGELVIALSFAEKRER